MCKSPFVKWYVYLFYFIRIKFNYMKKIVLQIFCSLHFTAICTAQVVNLPSTTFTIQEDFSTLGNSGTGLTTLPAGWWITEQGLGGNTTYRAGDGTSNSGDTYSFGTGTNTDRCFGSVASGTVQPNFGIKIRNQSGSLVTSFRVGFWMEQWRSGGRTGLDSLYFYYGIGSQFDSANTVGLNKPWVRFTAGDVVSKVTQTTPAGLDGNLAANRQWYQFLVTGVTLNNGDTLYLRWQDPNVGGNDDGLSIDEFAFTINGVLPVSWASFDIFISNNKNRLSWSTHSEINNSHFEVERSNDANIFETKGKVKGKGNSTVTQNYIFMDEQPLAGTTYYRIKQVDFDGQFSYSDVREVNNELVVPVIAKPNPFQTTLTLQLNNAAQIPTTIELVDLTGKAKYCQLAVVTKNNSQFEISVADLPAGIYYVRVSNALATTIQKVVKQ